MPLRIFLVLVSCVTIHFSFAQNMEKIGKRDGLAINGGLNFSSIAYAASGATARRDPFTWFMSGNFNLSLLDWNMPFTYSYTNQRGIFSQPFNQVSFSPHYKWIKTYIGNTSMSFSSYTLSGHLFFGAGIELTPGYWNIAAMYGRLQSPVAYDAVNQSDAAMAYERRGYGLKIGYEKNGQGLHAILFRASDDPASIPFIPSVTAIQPKDNTVISLIAKSKLSSNLSVEAEYALSGFTRNSLGAEENKSLRQNYIPFLFTLHSNSQFFSAMKGALAYNSKWFSLKFQYERVAPDYQTLGAYYFNNDMENITLVPSVKLLKGKINISLNSGFQRNNLDHAKLSDTRRFVNAVSVSIDGGKGLSASASYSNFSCFTRSRPQSDPFFSNTLDSLNFYQLSQNASASTNYNFVTRKLKQAILLSASYQVSAQRTGLVEQIPTKTYNSNLGYNIGWSPTKTSTSLSFNLTQTILNNRSTMYWGPSLSLSQSFFNNVLRMNIGSTFNKMVVEGKSNEGVYNTRAGLNYSPQTKNKKHGKLAAGLTLNYLKRPALGVILHGSSELTLTVNTGYTF